MKSKKLLSTLLLSALIVTGVFIPCNTTNAATLHPLGLKSLHENIKNIKKLQNSYGVSYSLPSSIDLSNNFPAVQDQGSLGSCATFAATYDKTYEENMKRHWGVSTINHFFSPAFIYSQVHLDSSPDGGGSNFSDVFNLLDSQGDTTLNDMPYNGNPYGYLTTPTFFQKFNAFWFRATSWSQLQSGNYNQIRQELANGMPVVIGIPVYPDFDELSPSNPIYDNTTGTNRGSHALCVVGYDDSKQAVKIINSWGTGWGVNGYGWISYKLLQNQNVDAYILND
jgi:C1A family cysteine protease